MGGDTRLSAHRYNTADENETGTEGVDYGQAKTVRAHRAIREQNKRRDWDTTKENNRERERKQQSRRISLHSFRPVVARHSRESKAADTQ